MERKQKQDHRFCKRVADHEKQDCKQEAENRKRRGQGQERRDPVSINAGDAAEGGRRFESEGKLLPGQELIYQAVGQLVQDDIQEIGGRKPRAFEDGKPGCNFAETRQGI